MGCSNCKDGYIYFDGEPAAKIPCQYCNNGKIKIQSVMDTQQERYKKTDEMLAKFPDGKRRFRESALFNKVIQTLIRDGDPFVIIDQLINSAEDSQKALEQYMNRTTPSISIKGMRNEGDCPVCNKKM